MRRPGCSSVHAIRPLFADSIRRAARPYPVGRVVGNPGRHSPTTAAINAR